MGRVDSIDPGQRPIEEPAEPIIEGRCTRCWGMAYVSVCDSGEITRIECGLCINHLEGQEAALEWTKVKLEEKCNLPKVSQGTAAKYRQNARFVSKIIPDMRRDKARMETQMKAAMKLPSREKGTSWITRHDVPAGEAGYLYLQAKLLAASIRSLPQDMAINRWNEVDLQSMKWTVSRDETRSPIRIEAKGTVHTKPETWEERVGAVMMRAMTAAFSCEVALKAILMTREHRARKTHDLVDLYNDLPKDSRARLRGDYAAIGDVWEKSRQIFGKWRYFANSADLKEAVECSMHSEIVQDLEKTVRVIVDECTMVGLEGQLIIKPYSSWTAKIKDEPSVENYREGVHFTVESGERAIVWK